MQTGRSLSLVAIVWLMRAVTLGAALWASFLVFFVNPINWKLYSRFTTWDWVWSWFSNLLTLVVAISLWWWVQRLLARKLEAKNADPVGTDNVGAARRRV